MNLWIISALKNNNGCWPIFSLAGPGKGRPFAVFANVGLYYSIHEPPLVPDVMVSLDIKLPDDLWLQKKNRTYLLWEHGKPPDLVIEIVSNKVGKEGDLKKTKYAQIGIKYYVIYDPAQRLSKQKLRIYELSSTGYRLLKGQWMAGIGLGLTFWQGKFEDITTTWLRWCDQEGNLLSTGDERAEVAQQQAEEERQRAAQAEESRAQERTERLAAQQQVELLLAQLRALGADPNPPVGSKATPSKLVYDDFYNRINGRRTSPKANPLS